MEKNMDNEMETWVIFGVILGIYWGYIGIIANGMETFIGVMKIH